MPVIFDFDGVIADTEKLHFEASRVVLAELGVPLDQARYYTSYLGYSDRDLAVAAATDHGLGDSPTLNDFVAAFIARKSVAFEALMTSGAVLFPGASACIRALASDFPLAIASGSFRHEIERVLDGAGLRSAFSAIVGADDADRHKPHPAPYLEAARRLQVHPIDCVAIEDSMWGLDSARAAGMKTIAVTTTYPATQLTADRIVGSLADVTPEIIRSVLHG